MNSATREDKLSEVQATIELLLAHRPVDDLSQPDGYRSLVQLESMLLGRVPHRPANPACSRRPRSPSPGKRVE